MRKVQRPSIGRQVHYYDRGDTPANFRLPLAATITAVHNDHVLPFTVNVAITRGPDSAAPIYGAFSINLYENYEQGAERHPNGGFAIWPPFVEPLEVND